eukprot:16431039-Heterocapsa_arctica.AAC.1
MGPPALQKSTVALLAGCSYLSPEMPPPGMSSGLQVAGQLLRTLVVSSSSSDSPDALVRRSLAVMVRELRLAWLMSAPST